MTRAGNAHPARWARRDVLYLGLVLGVALAHGLLYVLLVPPWQHYDEPSHFEYVRLIAERGRLPHAGEVDLSMRREIAASMEQFGFWRGMDRPRIAFLSQTPPNIGISALRHPPLYYLALALPQRLAIHQAVEVQLHLARATSLLFFLVVVAAAYGLTRDVFPERSWLPLGVAAAVALFPTLTDLCAAVNNDAGAAAVTALLLWGMVRVLQGGWTWRRGALLALLTVAAAATKTTALVAAGFAWVAYLGVAVIPWRQLGWRLLPLLAFVSVALVGLLDWSGQPAGWYISFSGAMPDLAVRAPATAVVGKHVLRLTAGGERRSVQLQQELPLERGRALRGQSVTLGVWMRVAEPPAPVVVLQLEDGVTTHTRRIKPSTEWQFYSLSAPIPSDAKGVRVGFLLRGQELTKASTVTLDGAVLLPGEWPADVAPTYADPRGQAGSWAGVPFDNWLRNGSAEKAWVALPMWLGLRAAPYSPWKLAEVWHSFWEWQRTGWVYPSEVRLLFQSFWGRFAWHHVALPDFAFRVLAGVSIAGGVGMVLAGARRGWSRTVRQRKAILVLLVVWTLGWATTFLRVHPVSVLSQVFYPGARYAAVVVVPSLLFLSLGLLELVPARWRWAGGLAGLVGLVLLDLLAVWGTIVPTYYGGS